MNFVFQKIGLIFDIQNWLWKYDIGTFWQTVIHWWIEKKNLWVCWFLAKNLAFYEPPYLKFNNRTDIKIPGIISMMKAAAIKPPTSMRVVKDSMTNHRIKIGRILFQSPKMSNPCTIIELTTCFHEFSNISQWKKYNKFLIVLVRFEHLRKPK